jgi:hypothetical protein
MVLIQLGTFDIIVSCLPFEIRRRPLSRTHRSKTGPEDCHSLSIKVSCGQVAWNGETYGILTAGSLKLAIAFA